MRPMHNAAGILCGKPGTGELELLEAAGNGEPRARREVVERYRPMVVRIARGLHGRGGSEELDDLVQVGMIGLLEALGRYEGDRGPFAPYASATISGTIKRHFRDRSWKVRIPRSLHDAATKVRARSGELEGRLGRPPNEAEIATATGLAAEEVREAQQLLAGAHPMSLEAPAGDGTTDLAELLGDEDPNYARAETRETIRRMTSVLDPDDRELLARRFALEQTQVEIAERVGGSQMRVSRRLRRVLTQMAAGAEVATD